MLFDDFEDEDEDDKPAAAIERRAGLAVPRLSSLCLGHEKVEGDLLTQIEQGRVPHAMIFAGTEGIGKATFAYRMARYMLSRGSADTEDAGPGLFGEPLPAAKVESMSLSVDHPDVRKVASGAHPDLLTVERQFDEKRGRFKGALDVEQVRRIPPFMRMTAAQGGWRVVVVDDADTMTRSAQNAILKVLEEPPPHALLMLITHRPGLMLPTIRSRSRMVHFEPPTPEIFARLLRADHPDLATRDIDTLYAIAGGSVGQGLRLLAEGGLEAVDKIMGLLHGWPQWDWPQIHMLADVMSRPGQDDSLQSFQDVWLWIIDSMLRAKARGQGALPGPLANDAVSRMLGHYSLPQWMAIRDALHSHFDTANHASLDRRHTVMGTFWAFAAA
ncbi:MAG: DNA polymerase III subunit delta' [Alphaproteobacteria bacterium]|nr:DNA polymerase III subunit delta' [Alphaproteobacteria bacterium]